MSFISYLLLASFSSILVRHESRWTLMCLVEIGTPHTGQSTGWIQFEEEKKKQVFAWKAGLHTKCKGSGSTLNFPESVCLGSILKSWHFGGLVLDFRHAWDTGSGACNWRALVKKYRMSHAGPPKNTHSENSNYFKGINKMSQEWKIRPLEKSSLFSYEVWKYFDQSFLSSTIHCYNLCIENRDYSSHFFFMFISNFIQDNWAFKSLSSQHVPYQYFRFLYRSFRL